jgi:hypothetical protein
MKEAHGMVHSFASQGPANGSCHVDTLYEQRLVTEPAHGRHRFDGLRAISAIFGPRVRREASAFSM